MSILRAIIPGSVRETAACALLDTGLGSGLVRRFHRAARALDQRLEPAGQWNFADLARGFADHDGRPRISGENVRRAARAYRKMKEDQAAADPVFLPSAHWAEYLDKGFSDIRQALETEDTGEAVRLLSGFLRDHPLGILLEAYIQLKARQRKTAYLAALETLQRYFTISAPDHTLAEIELPVVGNPRGYFLDGRFVNSASYFNGARVLLDLLPLVRDLDAPQFAEIGGGYGPTAYFLLKHHPGARYIDFDLPEIAVLAFAYLSTAMPEKRFLLYGEEEFGPEAIAGHDIVIMPNFMIERMPGDSVDLFVNECSFGEMNRKTVTRYLEQVQRVCRRYFVHLNHEHKPETRSEDSGLPAREYPIDPARFARVARTLDMPHQLFNERVGHAGGDIFSYTYLRRGVL